MKVLQFSGGLDSLACLELLKDTPGLNVITASTDGAYPERHDYLEKIKAAHPHLVFHHVTTDRELGVFGHPVDVLPLRHSIIGNLISGSPIKYQTFTDCCARALWLPLHQATLQLGATEIIRGQRSSDEHKAPIYDGYVENGITYKLPIENWTRSQVKEFVATRCPDLIPTYYSVEQTSRDCWDCTAYLKANGDRIRHLGPIQYAQVTGVLQQWKRDIAEETRW